MRPMYWASTRRADTPRTKNTAMSRCVGHSTSSGWDTSALPTGMASSAASYIDSAQYFALPEQFALDAIFHFAHQHHEVETLVGQFGLRRAGRRSRIVDFRTSGLDRAHGNYLVLGIQRVV